MPIDDSLLGSKNSFRLFPDPHGQAALLAVESLIHVLKERSVITPAEAVEVMTTALEVQADYAEAADGSGEKMRQSYALLSSIAESLRQDVPDSDEVEARP